jgi:L-iditol 2-dehydrogenase
MEVSKPVDPPRPDEVQIKIKATTLCGTDVHYYTHYRNGDIQIKEPLSQGHEASGVITIVGAGVQHKYNLKVGDRVALEVGVPCDECEDCRSDRYNICSSMKFRSSGANFPHYQGTLQDRLNHPAKWLHKYVRI